MDARHFDADVIVVGGGPAGSAAAISCATRGLRTILFERELFARERPGETLHPGIEPLLAQLGVAELDQVVGARHSGIWIEWNGERRFEPFGSDANGPWAGFQVWRQDFDDLLIARAQDAGVDVRRPCAVTGMDENGVVTDEGFVTAPVTVDATGKARWLARALDIASPARSPKFLARYGYAQGSCPERDDAPLLVGDARGWTWTAMVRSNTYQWTRLSFEGIEPDAGWMPQEFRQLKPLGRSRGADVTWRIADEVARPGWFMVGDAGAMLDPTSSRGVLKAIMSGMMAGHLIAAVLRGAAPAEEAAAAYNDWCAGWFAADAARLSQFYGELGITGFT